MKYLQPIILTEAIYRPIEDIINDIFERMIFAPLRAALRDAGLEIQNARGLALEKAIVIGTVYVEDGRIYGQFNSTISKELRAMGAKFDRATSSWKLPPSAALPARLQLAVAHADEKAQKAIDAVIHTLGEQRPFTEEEQQQLIDGYGQGVFRMNEQFKKSIKEIAIAPELTEATRRIIAEEWGENLELYIKGWTDEAILDLRQKVQANTLRGQRSANLVKMIQETQGASKAKAKFLARQETSLLMSKMREQRYKDIGSDRYRWTGVNDAREREDHRMLNGTIHFWANPPITNRTTGARNHPGEDFGCRCIAVPILEDENALG